ILVSGLVARLRAPQASRPLFRRLRVDDLRHHLLAQQLGASRIPHAGGPGLVGALGELLAEAEPDQARFLLGVQAGGGPVAADPGGGSMETDPGGAKEDTLAPAEEDSGTGRET